MSIGAVIFNLLWLRGYHTPYVPADQAQKVYLSLRPLASLPRLTLHSPAFCCGLPA